MSKLFVWKTLIVNGGHIDKIVLFTSANTKTPQ